MVCPFPEFQVSENMPARMAAFGTWIEAIHDAEFDAGDFGLPPELLQEAVESFSRNRFREMPVLHHAAHVQVFHRDEAWFLLHDGMDNLVLVVFTDARQALMKPLYRQFLFADVCRGSSSAPTFLFSHLVFPAQAPLLPPELPFQGSNPGRLVDISEDVPVAHDSQRLDAEVDADAIRRWRIGSLAIFVVTAFFVDFCGHGNIIASRDAGDRPADDIRVLRQVAVFLQPHLLQRRNHDLVAKDPPVSLVILREIELHILTGLPLEARESTLAMKEALKRMLGGECKIVCVKGLYKSTSVLAY